LDRENMRRAAGGVPQDESIATPSPPLTTHPLFAIRILVRRYSRAHEW
jgi:hypothetical protein